MKEQNNLETIKKNMEFLGFGNRLHDLVETAMQKGLPEFGIGSHYQMPRADQKGVDNMYYQLRFSKNEQGDYHFTSYHAKLQKANELMPISQEFSAENRDRITRLQAYKLLSGMALEKDIYVFPKGVEGQDVKPDRKSVWYKLELDLTDAYGQHPLKSFYPEYGFDVKAALQKYPLRDINKSDKLEELAAKIKAGTLAESILKIDNRYIPVYLTANPQMKNLVVFDQDGREVRQSDIFPHLKQEEAKNEKLAQTEQPESTRKINKPEQNLAHDNSIGR